MKLLSSTPLPPCQSPEAGSQPVYTHSLTDESYIAVALTDTTVHVLSSRTGAILQKRPFEQPGSVAIGLVIDGDTLILAYAKDPSLTIYDIPSETVLSTLSCPDGQAVYILAALFQDAYQCIIAAFDIGGSMRIWDIRARKHLRTVKLHDDIAHFSTVVGSQIVTSSPDGTLAVTDWQTGQRVWRKTLGEAQARVNGRWVGNAVFALAVWEGKVVAGTRDGRLWVFDLASGAPIIDWQAANSLTSRLIPSGDRLIQATGGEIKVWSTKTYQLLRGVQIFDRNITEAILVSGTLVACGRNALQASDRCGLDEGLQGWRGALEDSTENLKPGSIGEGGAGGNQKGTADFAIFRLGPPIRAARGVAGLSANRLVIFVLRGAIWSVEIWQG